MMRFRGWTFNQLPAAVFISFVWINFIYLNLCKFMCAGFGTHFLFKRNDSAPKSSTDWTRKVRMPTNHWTYRSQIIPGECSAYAAPQPHILQYKWSPSWHRLIFEIPILMNSNYREKIWSEFLVAHSHFSFNLIPPKWAKNDNKI